MDRLNLDTFSYKIGGVERVVKLKTLIDGFYRTRKNRGAVASSYSYECKDCTIKRIIDTRKKQTPFLDWDYPDW